MSRVIDYQQVIEVIVVEDEFRDCRIQLLLGRLRIVESSVLYLESKLLTEELRKLLYLGLCYS